MNHRSLLFASSLLLIHSCSDKPKTESRENNADTLREQFEVIIHDSSALALIDSNANFEILAKGFYWSEGPLWLDELQALIFSDVPANKIYKWTEKDSLSIYLNNSGHPGADNKNSGRGSNGLILDHDNNLLICQHGDRRIAEMDADLKNPQAQFSTVADSYKGKRFNSPNDLAIDSAGNIYFTDPPYGQAENKTGEIGFKGVFKVSADKEVLILIDSLTWPNGIALSIDQKSLYINQSDPQNPVLYKYEISEEGSLKNGKLLFDFMPLAKVSPGLPDGLKVHKSGNIFATGPGGIHIISPEGMLLATINTQKASANCAFGPNYKYLYTTTTDLLIRVELK